MKERVRRIGWRSQDWRRHVGMEIAQRSEGNQMVEEPYSDRMVGMEITVMMMTRRKHVGLENNDGGMFWRAMEGLPKRETPEGEKDGEHKRE